MKRRTSSEAFGQLAFVGGEHAEKVMPAAWLLGVDAAGDPAQVRSRFESFRARVKSFDRHDLLSLTGLYALCGALGELAGSAVYPEIADVEFLQALLLGTGVGDAAALPRDQVSATWRELATQCFVASKGDDLQEGDRFLPGLARIHAAFYRNPYGDAFFDRMVVAITEEYDKRYVRDGRVAGMGRSLIRIRQELWARFQRHISRSRLATTSNRKELLDLLRSMVPDLNDREFDSCQPEQQEQIVLQALEDVALKELFILDWAWVSKSEFDGFSMGSFLESIALNELEELLPESIASSNPVWEAPFVRVETGFALYSPITLTSFPFKSLRLALKDELQSKERLEKIRGWFVEQEGKRLFEDAFPSGQVVLGGFWQRNAEERIEADVLVLIAGRLLVFEAKGALIPDRVRFGARDATVQFLKKVWGKAARQGAAFSEHVSNARTPVEIRSDKGDVVMTLDPAEIRSVSRFGISVEQVGPLMNSSELLREAGVLQAGTPFAPCIILSELAQVLRHLPDEAHSLHYLLRRCQLAEHKQIIGDEMDIFTTYVQYGFSDLPTTDKMLMLLGASYSLAHYMDDEGLFQLPADSSLNFGPYLQRVLDYAKERGSRNYLELSLMLLDMPHGQQVAFERQVQAILGERPKQNDWPIAMAKIESPGGNAGLAVVIVDDVIDTLRWRKVGLEVAQAAGVRFETTSVAVVIRIWNAPAPYEALYVFGPTLQSDRLLKERRAGAPS